MEYFLNTYLYLQPSKQYFFTKEDAIKRLLKIINRTLTNLERQIKALEEKKEPLTGYEELKKTNLENTYKDTTKEDNIFSSYYLLEIDEKICTNYKDIFLLNI